MPYLGSPDHFLILGGPRDGERIRLPQGKKTLTVVILHPPAMQTKMDPNEIVATSNFEYVTKSVLVGTAWVDVLVPNFWNDGEVLLTLLGNYKAAGPVI